MKLYLLKMYDGNNINNLLGVYTDLNKCEEDKKKLEEKYRLQIDDADWQIYIHCIESNHLYECGLM